MVSTDLLVEALGWASVIMQRVAHMDDYNAATATGIVGGVISGLIEGRDPTFTAKDSAEFCEAVIMDRRRRLEEPK